MRRGPLRSAAPGFPTLSRTISLGAAERVQNERTLDLPGISVMTKIKARQ
jgi:hypothetical protein